MLLNILGCSGGVSKESGTTAFLVDDDLLLDAGTGIESLDECSYIKIRSVLLTHAHLDHISHLPFLLNNTIGKVEHTVNVYGLPATIKALREHIFNNIIWPDFTKIPTENNPCLTFHEIRVGDELQIGNKKISVLPAFHTVPSVGFLVADDKNNASFAFSGDTSQNKAFWLALNNFKPVDMLIVDNQYLEAEKEISEKAKHYYAKNLKKDYDLLIYQPKLFLTHLPPTNKEAVFAEAQQVFGKIKIDYITSGQTFNLPEVNFR